MFCHRFSLTFSTAPTAAEFRILESKWLWNMSMALCILQCWLSRCISYFIRSVGSKERKKIKMTQSQWVDRDRWDTGRSDGQIFSCQSPHHFAGGRRQNTSNSIWHQQHLSTLMTRVQPILHLVVWCGETLAVKTLIKKRYRYQTCQSCLIYFSNTEAILSKVLD